MDRGALAEYLGRAYGPLADAAGFADYSLAIDATWRMLGVAEADLPHADSGAAPVADVLALADYFTLRAVWRQLSMYADIHAGDPQVSKARSQFFKQTQVLLADAKAAVPSQYAVDGGDFALGKIQLDFLEPNYTGLIPFPYY